jgi:hypothetical protein
MHTRRVVTPDNLRDALAEVIQPAFDEWLFRMHGVVSSCGHETEAEGIADALAPTVACLIADACPWADCDGSFACESAWHVHGCYSDTGQCDDPLDHPGYEAGRAEQAAADRERIEALADEWESRAFNARACAASRLGLSDAEGLRAHADLMQRRADDLRAALDSEGGVT